MSMQKIAIINLKGGVGKSVTACNLACILGQMHKRRVLVLDLDKQANTSKFFRCFAKPGPTMADVMTCECKLDEVVLDTEYSHVSVAPSCMEMLLANKQVMLDVVEPQQNRIRRALHPYAEAYNYCIMDCPPDLDMATINALTAADWVIIPLDCDEWAFDGLNEILKQVAAIRENYNPGLKIMGILATKYTRGGYSEAALHRLKEMGLPTFYGPDGEILRIDYSIKVKESKSEHKPIYAYRVPANLQYRQLADIVESKVKGEQNG